MGEGEKRDGALARRAAAGDREAFAALLERHYDRIIRYKRPDADTSTLVTRAVTTADEFESVGSAPREARFAAAVAGFGQLLRGGRYTGDYGYTTSLPSRAPPAARTPSATGRSSSTSSASRRLPPPWRPTSSDPTIERPEAAGAASGRHCADSW